MSGGPDPNDISVAPISRQIDRFVYVSLGLSVAILACSMGYFGYASFWLSEAAIFFTIIHHSIVLHNRKKLRKLHQLHASSLPIPASSRIPVILMAWFIAVLYTAALCIVCYFMFLFFEGYFEVEWDPHWIATMLELVCLVVEIPLVIVIALWSMRERRAVFGVAGDAKWYHLPQYRRTC